MEDFSALASRIAVGLDDVRGCLIVSRDGLVLGAFPPEAEDQMKPAWLRFAGLGDAEKGFVEFADELWVYVRRGPYAAFAAGDTSIRPGLLIDQLEQALLRAEEQRAKKEALKIPEAPSAPSGKPRTSLHKEVRAPEPAPVTPAPAADQAPTPPPAESAVPSIGDDLAEMLKAAAPAESAEAEPAASQPEAEPAAPEPAPPKDPEPDGDVDRVLLAQEFSRLLQEGSADDEDK